jgi:hypothetical protein
MRAIFFFVLAKRVQASHDQQLFAVCAYTVGCMRFIHQKLCGWHRGQ